MLKASSIIVSHSATSPDLDLDIAAMDKRQLLQWLKTHCSKPFLQQQGLLGSDTLILKKKNKSNMVEIYSDWARQSSCNTQRNIKDSDLINSFREIFLTMRTTIDSSTSCYLLLLHEDYPVELPVFGPSSAPSPAEKVEIICALGCVRDCSDRETGALIAAAQSLGIACVGANLGRTAEFTSKILTALVAHHLAGRMHRAVRSLPLLPCLLKEEEEEVGGERWASLEAIAQSSFLKKLSKRHESHSNDMKERDRKSTKTRSEDGRPDLPTQPSLCQCDFRVAAWLPILPSEIDTALGEARESLHGLIQLLVSTLWRSRLASECQLLQQKQVAPQVRLPRSDLRLLLSMIFRGKEKGI